MTFDVLSSHIAYRKDRSLRQTLVSSRLPSTPDISQSGTNPCGRPRCKTCKVTTAATTLRGPNSQWTIHGKFTCTTNDCIYAIHCKKCQQLYIGETKRRLADRVTEHLRSIRLNTTGLPVAAHFNSNDHNIKDFEVSVVRSSFNNDEVRKQEEERMIFRLGCLQPRGINVSFRSFPIT